MVIHSFSSQDKVYQTTSDTCTCPDHQNRKHTCKHMRKAIRIEQGSPTTVNEARVARIERNRLTAAAYYRMSFMPY